MPTYSPPDQWNIGQTCKICTITQSANIDSGQVFDGTWHDSTHFGSPGDASLQIDFTGTAVYVYNILVNTVAGLGKLTQLVFILDGDQVGTFIHEPDSTSQVIYNALVYSNTTLSNEAHTLEVVLTGSDTTLCLFDYAIYTVEVDTDPPVPFQAAPPSRSSPSPSPSASQSSQSPVPQLLPSTQALSSSQPSASSDSQHVPSSFTRPLPSSPTSLSSLSSPSSQSLTSSESSDGLTDTHPDSLSPVSPLPSSSSPAPSSEAPQTHSSTDRSTGVIVGAVVGGVFVAVGASLLLCLLCRRRARGQPQSKPPRGRLSQSRVQPKVMKSGLATTTRKFAKAGRPLGDPSATGMSRPKQRAGSSPTTVTAVPLLPSSTRSSVHGPSTASEKSIGLSPSERSAYVSQQIQALQAQMEEIRAAQRASVAAANWGHPSDAERNMAAELVALRSERDALRAELGERHRSAATSPFEPPPRYERH